MWRNSDIKCIDMCMAEYGKNTEFVNTVVTYLRHPLYRIFLRTFSTGDYMNNFKLFLGCLLRL